MIRKTIHPNKVLPGRGKTLLKWSRVFNRVFISHEFEVKRGVSLEGSASVYPVFKLYSPRKPVFFLRQNKDVSSFRSTCGFRSTGQIRNNRVLISLCFSQLDVGKHEHNGRNIFRRGPRIQFSGSITDRNQKALTITELSFSGRWTRMIYLPLRSVAPYFPAWLPKCRRGWRNW